MGEACKKALRVDFDRSIKLEFHGAKVTSDIRPRRTRRALAALAVCKRISVKSSAAHS